MENAETTEMAVPSVDATGADIHDAVDSHDPEMSIAALGIEVEETESPRLTGLQKAAVLLVSVGEERASKILRHLDEDEAAPLLIEIGRTEDVPPEHVNAVMREVVETALARGYFRKGGINYARDILTKTFGEAKAQELLARLETAIEVRPFKFLSRTPPEQIYGFVRRENPQLVAMLVAHLPDNLGAKVIDFFPQSDQPEIIERVAKMGTVSPETIRMAEDTVKQLIHIVNNSQVASAGGVESAAALLNRVDRQTERNVFDYLGEKDSSLADQIRHLLFVFEDIAQLDPRAIQQIIQRCDDGDLALALRGTEPTLQDTFLSNMSDRAAEQLKEEMELAPKQRRKDVEEAQTRVVAVARRLEANGDIVLFRGGDEDGVV